jgi:hypothetical protein
MGSASLRKREMKKRLNPKGGQPAAARLGASGSAGAGQSPPLDQFDALLARHRPFADSDYLLEQLHLRYQQRLATISERLPVAGALASALAGATDHRRFRTIGDPVVRHAIHEALRQVWNEAQPPGAQHGPSAAGALPLPECAEVFAGAVAHLGRADRPGGPLESGGAALRRLGPEPWQGSVWTEEHGDDVFGRCFRRIVRDNFRGEPLCAPSPADVAMLARGAELLGVLLPLCARSVLGHTHLAVVVPHVGAWSRKGSCSEFRISGTIFLNRQMLRNPWWVAEHLLHESLHQKLYDFRHTHSLLVEDLTPDAPPAAEGVAVHAIWNLGGAGDGSSGWDTFRTIAAFHVYVHLALLGARIERGKVALVKRFGASPDGCLPALTHRREALERAHYLGRRLREVCWPEMGPAGRLLVSWLGSVLNAIDPGPPPPDSRYLHLVLNRYMLEGSRFAEHEPLDLAVGAELGERVADEGETVRRVMLTMLADDPDVEELAQAMARRPDEGGGAAFLRFRGTVTRLLHARSPDGYGLRTGSPALQSAPLDDLIRTMVDDSSRRLEPLLATLP